MTDRRDPPPGHWVLSPGLAAGILCGVVCLVAGFVFARVELALVGVPILVAAAYGWDRRPGTGAGTGPLVHPRAVVDDGTAAESGLAVRASVSADARMDAVHLRWEQQDRPPLEAVISPAQARALYARVPMTHSGPQRLIRMTARGIGPDATFVTLPADPVAVERVVRPRLVPLRSLPLPARLAGLTGPHPSSRPGDGGEFRDVARFQPGDRLRRIDWKATARRAQLPGELYVRRTMATSDAAVQLVLDSRDDVTGRVLDWAAPYPEPGVSSQDLAREAAGSLAAAYSAVGDRVAFDDLADARRALPPRSGRRHLERVLRAVERTAPRGPAGERVRPPLLEAGALVYILSTFLDDQPMRVALTWRAAGHRVIAVDVLPHRLVRDLPRRDAIALRVIELERALRFRRLTAGGVEWLTWQDPQGDAREARMRELSRPRRPA